MKRLLSTIFFVLSLWGVALAQTKMTLAEAIEFAQKNNIQIQNGKLEVDKSQAKVGEYLSIGLPQISGNADLADNFLIPTTWLPAQIFDPTAPEGALAPVQFGTKYTGRATFDLQQMIFNGSYFVGLKASKTYTELAIKDQLATRIDVVSNIKKAYYGVLVNLERLELIEKNYDRLDSLLKNTRAMYDAGFAEKIDVNRVAVQFNNIQNTRNNAKTGLEVSFNLLKFQLGMPISEPLELTDDLQSIQYKVLEDGYADGFEYKNRIEYSKLETNLELVKMDIKNTRSQYLPSLDLYGTYGASYGTSSFTNFLSFGENWVGFGVVGLRLKVPIFDGFYKGKVVQQKKMQLNQVENSFELTKNQIDMEQAQAKLNLDAMLESLVIQRENMELSEEVYNVTFIKYQEGVGSNVEVMDADATFKEAQVNYYAALYDALIASVDLEKAFGKLLENETN